ncbi:hypothetical protein 1, partial [Clerodendrum trichotomum rhabdo-like virus]
MQTGSQKPKSRSSKARDKAAPASRITSDSRAFLVEEKFDTWLDLGSVNSLVEECKRHKIWLTKWMKPWQRVLGAESVVMLHKSGIRPNHLGNYVLTPCLPAMVIKELITKPVDKCHVSAPVWRKIRQTAQEAARTSFACQVEHLTRHVSHDLLRHSAQGYLGAIDRMSHLPCEVVGLGCAVEDLLKLLERYKELSSYVPVKKLGPRVATKLKEYPNVLELPSLQATALLTLDLCTLTWKKTTYLLSKDLMLELVNKVTEVHAFLLYSHLTEGVSLPVGHYQHALQFLTWCTDTVCGHMRSRPGKTMLEDDNKGFSVLKAVEGLGVAWMIMKGDQSIGWWNESLLHNLWSALYSEDLVSSPNFTSSQLYNLFSQMTVPQVAELIGCVKLAGHPSIEVEKGLQKLYDRTHNELEVDMGRVQESIGVLTRDICKQFYIKHGRYPIMEHIPDSPHDCLRRTLQHHQRPTDGIGRLAFQTVPAMLWAEVLFGKNAEFDPIDNQLVLLKDKALGLNRNKIWPILMEQVSEKDEMNVMRAENRRALLSFIVTPHYSESFAQYMHHYEHDDPWRNAVLDYLVIKLTPKELEHKSEGRMFGASPREERNRRITQEDNTMRFMESYIPDQLMTQDELSTLKKLYSFRYYQQMYPGHYVFQMSFDFSRWNNNMRHNSVDIPAAHILDRWFGKRLWGKTMRAFENSLIYYMDRTHKRYWEGQFGGIEGLNQATWSLVFLGGIKNALERIGVMYQVTVKGDDVRAAIAIDEAYVQAHGFDGVRERILTNLQQLCVDMGWTLNPNETFVSLTLIATSKQYQFKNSWLCASTKKLVKCRSLANLLFPTTEDVVSSVFSTAHSACASATAVIPAFQAASMIAAEELLRCVVTRSSKITCDPNLIATLLMWPQVLGGPGALPLQTFFVRGENDMLSASVSLLRYLLTEGPEQIRPMAHRILGLPFIDPPHFPLLMGDPYSLCLDIPERAASVLKRIMKRHLRRIAKNDYLSVLLNDDARYDKATLIEILWSMLPYCAKVATVLWECSPFYVVDEVLSKFLQSQTVFKFLSMSRRGRDKPSLAHKSLKQVLNAAEVREKFWLSTVSTSVVSSDTLLGVPITMWHDPLICSTHIVHMAREACWQKPIVGITYPSLTDQVHMYTMKDLRGMWPNVDMGPAVKEVWLLHDHASFQTDYRSHHYAAAASSIPWIGASTATNYHFVQGMTRITSSTLNKILKLVALRLSGAYLGPDFVRLVDIMIRALTGINLEAITVLQPERGGGHIPHRVACNSYSMTTMPNFRTNIMQLVKVNQEGFKIIRGDLRDRTINYAAIHFYSIVLGTLPLQFQPLMPDGYPNITYCILHGDLAQHPAYGLCEWCCCVIDDNQITVTIPANFSLAKYQSIPL